MFIKIDDTAAGRSSSPLPFFIYDKLETRRRRACAAQFKYFLTIAYSFLLGCVRGDMGFLTIESELFLC